MSTTALKCEVVIYTGKDGGRYLKLVGLPEAVRKELEDSSFITRKSLNDCTLDIRKLRKNKPR
jgi:hypothetical protein